MTFKVFVLAAVLAVARAGVPSAYGAYGAGSGLGYGSALGAHDLAYGTSRHGHAAYGVPSAALGYGGYQGLGAGYGVGALANPSLRAGYGVGALASPALRSGYGVGALGYGSGLAYGGGYPGLAASSALGYGSGLAYGGGYRGIAAPGLGLGHGLASPSVSHVGYSGLGSNYGW